MYSEYISRLKQALADTKFFKENAKTEFPSYEEGMETFVNAVLKVKKENRQLFFIGNGGSSAIASHMTADFMKNGGMKTYSLYDSAVMTCMGNDYGYGDVFSRQLGFLVNKGDMLVAISSSGNSQNIVNAINTVKSKGGKVVTFSGFKPDNKIKAMGDYSVFVPEEHYGIVESVHNLILQQAVDTILDIDGVAV
jgi:Phosphoheptose isomerase